MKLYCVQVTSCCYVVANSPEEASKDAAHAVDASSDPWNEFAMSSSVDPNTVESIKVVDPEWHDAIPYGSAREDDSTIAELFEDGKLP
jgi:hypothetical protein